MAVRKVGAGFIQTEYRTQAIALGPHAGLHLAPRKRPALVSGPHPTPKMNDRHPRQRVTVKLVGCSATSGYKDTAFRIRSQLERIECAMPKTANHQCSKFSHEAEILLGSNPVNAIPVAAKIPNVALGDDFIAADLQTLTKMQLRAKYKAEESCHKNMLRRVKTKGAVIHPNFRKFDSFLSIMGSMPQKGMTVDRIDNNDPEYAPHKVRWADKSTQNSNKSDSHIFVCATTGKTYSTAQLAKLHGVSLSAIRKRKSNGWTMDEIIAGHRFHSGPVSPKINSQGYIPAPSVKDLHANFIAFSVPPLWGFPVLDFPAGIYTAQQRRRICQPTMDDHRFSQEARYYQNERQYGDGEHIPMTKGELIRSMLEDNDGHLVTGLEDDGEEWHFVSSITRNRHFYFPNLPQHLRKIVEHHDHEWVEKMELRFQKLEVQSAMNANAAAALKDQLGTQM